MAMRMWALVLLGAIVVGGVAVLMLRPPQPTPPPNSTAYVPPNNSATVSPSSTSTASQTPDVFVEAFYTWYMQGMQTDVHFTSSTDFQSGIGQWLTPEFIADFQNRTDADEQDPVLLAQDFASSWPSNIQASLVAQSSTSSTVIVSLGTGIQLQKMSVTLLRTDAGWRIDSIAETD